MASRRRAVVVVVAGLAASAAAGAEASAPDAELVTVTPTSFVATWTTTDVSDTTVCVDDRPCVRQEDATRFHRAEVGGLTPGTRYRYRLMSGGTAQAPSATNPGTFTTLVKPPGRHLFDFAIVSDTHIGEGCSGTAVTAPNPIGSVPSCFSSAAGEPPYPATLARATVDELKAGGIELTVLNGDNTGHGDYDQVQGFKTIYGGLAGTWGVARGAHDRAGQTKTETRCGTDDDCFRTLLFGDRQPGRIFFSQTYKGFHFVALDSAKPGDGSGDLTDPAQNAFLEADLEAARRRGEKTFVYFHHPVTEYANTTSFPPVVFGVRPEQGRQEFLDRMARFPNVVGVLNSHTHRNYVTYAPGTGVELPYIENGPTKEYPGGYSIIRVYEGGYTRNFRRLACGFCRDWISRTRDEYSGLYPQYTLGTLSARNFTHVYDCDAPTPPPSPPSGNESATGGDTARAACPEAAAGAPAPSGGSGTGGGGSGSGGGGSGSGGGGSGSGGGPTSGGSSVGNPSGETPRQRASRRRCHIPRAARVSRSGIEAIRIGDRRSVVIARTGQPNQTRVNVLIYCVEGGRTVRVALSARGRATVVATTGPAHVARGVHRGTPLRAMRRAWPDAFPVRGYWRTGPRSPVVFGTSASAVRFVAVIDRRLIGKRETLVRYLRRLGLLAVRRGQTQP